MVNDDDGDPTAAQAAAEADALDPSDPARAAGDGGEGDVEQDRFRGDPVPDEDGQEVLIDAVLAADEPDPEPDGGPDPEPDGGQ